RPPSKVTWTSKASSASTATCATASTASASPTRSTPTPPRTTSRPSSPSRRGARPCTTSLPTRRTSTSRSTRPEDDMNAVTTVVIGAGHAGLAMSRCLTDRSIDHVVLERGEVANTWRTERWDSLRLLTPNWQSRLPGHAYDGDDPDGFMTMPEVISFIDDYARAAEAPVQTHTAVTSVRAAGDGYVVETDQGEWHAPTVALATGACNVPDVPAVAAAVPAGRPTPPPFPHRRPRPLRGGGVVVGGGPGP